MFPKPWPRISRCGCCAPSSPRPWRWRCIASFRSDALKTILTGGRSLPWLDVSKAMAADFAVWMLRAIIAAPLAVAVHRFIQIGSAEDDFDRRPQPALAGCFQSHGRGFRGVDVARHHRRAPGGGGASLH